MTRSPWQKLKNSQVDVQEIYERATSEYDLTAGEDKITLLSMFQQINWKMSGPISQFGRHQWPYKLIS